LFLDALQPDVMPRDGQRAGAAIDWSTRLLQRAGARRGDILVLTDHADSVAVDAAADAASSGYRVSVLGLGTDAGSSYRRVDGSIARARLDAASLRKLANAGNGRYAPLSGDDADLRSLQLLDVDLAQASGTGRSGLAWRDEGYWLLPPLLVLMLFAFRRRSGAAWSLVLLCVALPMGNVRAADLWRRPDQAAYARVRQGNEAYRRGDFAAAAQAYRDVDSALAHYNRGNALAKAGQYPQAIAAYDEALRRQPGMADAIYNKHAVQAAMKRQQSSSSDGGKPQQSQKGQGNQQTNPQSGHAPQPDTGQSQAKSPDSRQDRDKQDTQQAGQPSNTPPAKPQDAQSQADADRAQRERMQRALQQRRDRAAKQRADTAQPGETPEQRERRLANDAWLRRVPDDPGGLLRAKFRLEYERRAASGRIEQ
jgi:Ca-activated chloride channel family protein